MSELIAAVVGALIAMAATSLQSHHNAQQTIRLATAERLHQTYGEVLAAAWVRDDATGLDSWNVTKHEDWGKQVLRIGDVAQARLALEDPAKTKEIHQCYRDINRDYFQWRLRQPEFLRLSENDNLRDREYEDLGEMRKQMEALHNTIKSNANELERLCKEHVAELRTPLPTWWQTQWQVWTARLDR